MPPLFSFLQSSPAPYTHAQLKHFRAALREGDDAEVSASLYACPGLARSVDIKGRTALHIAGIGRCGDTVVEWLVEQCIDVAAVDGSLRTALHCAVSGKAPVARSFLSGLLRQMEPADVDRKDRNGRTAVMTAAMNGHLIAVKMLLDAGANLRGETRELSVDEVTDRTMRKVFGPVGGGLPLRGLALFALLPIGVVAYGGGLIAGKIRHERTKYGFRRTALELAALHGHETVAETLQVAHFQRGEELNAMQVKVLKDMKFHRLSPSEMKEYLQREVEATQRRTAVSRAKWPDARESSDETRQHIFCRNTPPAGNSRPKKRRGAEPDESAPLLSVDRLEAGRDGSFRLQRSPGAYGSSGQMVPSSGPEMDHFPRHEEVCVPMERGDRRETDGIARRYQGELTNFLSSVCLSLRHIGENRQRIFISYAWEAESNGQPSAGQSRLRDKLVFLRENLEAMGFQVFLDTSDMAGELNPWMETHINRSDYVMLIGTDRLASRILLDPNSGAATEFRLISAKVVANPGCLFPLLVQGKIDTAFPPSIRNHLILNLTERVQGAWRLEWTRRLTQLADMDHDYPNAGLIPRLIPNAMDRHSRVHAFYRQILQDFRSVLDEIDRSCGDSFRRQR